MKKQSKKKKSKPAIATTPDVAPINDAPAVPVIEAAPVVNDVEDAPVIPADVVVVIPADVLPWTLEALTPLVLAAAQQLPTGSRFTPGPKAPIVRTDRALTRIAAFWKGVVDGQPVVLELGLWRDRVLTGHDLAAFAGVWPDGPSLKRVREQLVLVPVCEESPDGPHVAAALAAGLAQAA